MDMLQRNLVKPIRQRLAVFLAFGLAIAVTVLISHSLFHDATAQQESDGATVRIAALRSEAGSVRVALQQQGAGGSWGDRQHPALNTVRADAPVGVWLHSSSLQLAAPSTEAGPLYCIVSHGGLGDRFWRVVRGFSRQAAIDAGIDVRFSQSLDGGKQAAAIDRCAADGAVVIASTLADPQAVQESLLAAKAGGSRIITFNSGAAEAASVGSELHIALDEAAAGRLVGEQFNVLGISGTVGCILHEADNVGLEERCTALASAYEGGETIRVSVPEGGDADAVEQAVAARLLDADQPSLTALVALNGDTLLRAFKAIIATADQLDHDVQIAGVGPNGAVARQSLELRNRHLAFVTNHAGEAQAYLITAALKMIHEYPTPAKFILTPTILTATPFIYDSGAVRADPAEFAEAQRRLQARLALGDEYGSGE